MPIRGGYVDARPERSSPAAEATFASFGYEWNTFGQIHPEDEEYWHWYFADIDLGNLKGKVGLDAGCGKGRYTAFTARYLDAVVALDGSNAVAVAAANLSGCPTALVVRADLREPPLARDSFDFISCLGVLHHLEDPRAGFDSIARLLAPGGILLLYVYSRPSGLGLRSIGLSAASLLRRGTTRMPHRVLRRLAWPVSVALWLFVVQPGAAIARRGRSTGTTWPLAAYYHKPVRALWLDTFDRLSAPIEHRYVWDDLRPWYDEAGLTVDSVRDESGLLIVAHRN